MALKGDPAANPILPLCDLEVEEGDFRGFAPEGTKICQLEGSTLKGAGFHQLTTITKAGGAVLINTKSQWLALAVDAQGNAKAVAEARLRFPVAFFRGSSYDVGRLSRFLQEPIVIEDNDEPVIVLLPRISMMWAKRTAPLKAQTTPAPTTQIVLPPILPELHVQLAEAIGNRIGATIAVSISELTEAFRGFTRDAALAAAAGEASDD